MNRADDGTIRVYTADVPGRPQPDPEILAILAQGIEIQNL